MKPSLSQITYAELVIAAGLVLAALGIWGLADRLAGRFLLDQTPRLENYEAQAGVPMLQARQAGVQAELEEVQKQLSDQEMLRMQQSNQAEALEAAYPQLAARKPELGKLVALPADVVDGYLSAGVQLAAARSQLEALEGEWQALVAQQEVLTTQDTATSTARRDLLQAQLAQVQSELIKQQMELLHQQAAAAAYVQSFPELAALPAAGRLPIPVLKRYLDLLRSRQESQALAGRYQAHLDAVEHRLAQASQEVEGARRQAQIQFEQAGQTVEDRRRWLALGGALLGSALVIIVLGLPAVLLLNRLLFEKKAEKTSPWPAILLAGGIALILLGYQAFAIAGVVAAGIFMLAVVLLSALIGAALRWAARLRATRGAAASPQTGSQAASDAAPQPTSQAGAPAAAPADPSTTQEQTAP